MKIVSALIFTIITVVLCTYSGNLYSQQQAPAGKVTVIQRPWYFPLHTSSPITADTTGIQADTVHYSRILLPNTRQLGKKGFQSFTLPAASRFVQEEKSEISSKQPTAPALSIHGNVLYNVDYRSYIDTPYSEKDVYYHTVQTYLDVVYKDRYPMRIYLTNRFSNSAFTRTFTDLNMQYSANDFKNRLLQKIKSYPSPDLPADSLAFSQQQLNAKRLELSRLKGWLRDPAVIQRLIEAKERAYYGNKMSAAKSDTAIDLSALQLPESFSPGMPQYKEVPGYLTKLFMKGGKGSNPKIQPPSLPPADTTLFAKYDARKRQVDSLQQEIAILENKYNNYKHKLNELRRQKNSNVDQTASIEDLDKEIHARNIPDSALPKGYKALWAVKSFGIGRTMVDYSELSAKNVSITGVQMEYNPSYYVAVATGTIDYRFRDFIVKNGTMPGQHLHLLRLGTGQKNGNNIIATWYTGKKQLYNNSNATQVAAPDPHLLGFTIEGNYRINRTTYVTAEVAKSSMPYYTNPGPDKSLLAAALSFNDHSNEAYSLKLQSVIRSINTRFTGFYKHYGANFQSFSLVTTGVEQSAWMIKADQPFFRKRLMVTASLKENDYNNPTVNATYQNNTVFKSIQASLRIPKWPVLFVGYYPSSQLTKLSDNSYTENMFYSLVANMNYYYKMYGVNMSSTAMYTRFYNKQSDTAFIYSNTSNLMYNHAIFYKKLMYQATASVALNADYNLYTIDNDAQYALLDWLSLGAGVKYNEQTGYDIKQVGYKGSVIIKIKKIGEIQLMVDKGFIPGANRRLVENNTGRFSFFKIF